LANNRLARPYITAPVRTFTRSGITYPAINIPLGFAAQRTIGKYHTGGSYVKIPHTVGGRTRFSIYYTGETWHGEKAITFRLRRGTGDWGTKKGERIQDQYPYFVPSSINNAQGAAARSAFATAVSNWQSVLTEDEKIEYNKRAAQKNDMSGYNLYIREYVRANA